MFYQGFQTPRNNKLRPRAFTLAFVLNKNMSKNPPVKAIIMTQERYLFFGLALKPHLHQIDHKKSFELSTYLQHGNKKA